MSLSYLVLDTLLLVTPQKVTNSELKFDRHYFIHPAPDFSWTFGFRKGFDNVELSMYTKFQKIENSYDI